MTSLEETVGLLALLGDPNRVRLMALLAEEELAVSELMAITELGQSRVSTHLGRLREAGLLRDRRAGNASFYTMAESIPAPAARLWSTLLQELDDGVLDADRARARALREARRRSHPWPDAIAGEMERHYSPGRTWEATARGLLAFLALGDVLDVGSGDGAVAQLLAHHARSICCVDRSERVVEAARTRLSELSNVHSQVGDMHALPFANTSFDQVLHLNTLTYSEQPELALAEAARVLRPYGTLVLVTLAEHRQTEVTAAYGHCRSGFSPEQLAGWLLDAGLSVRRCSITSRERRPPHFEVVTAEATKPVVNPGDP
jgi:SAM-dependent methyltransferase